MTEIWVLTTEGLAYGQGASEATTELARIDPYVPAFYPAFASEAAARAFISGMHEMHRSFYTPVRLEVRS